MWHHAIDQAIYIPSSQTIALRIFFHLLLLPTSLPVSVHAIMTIFGFYYYYCSKQVFLFLQFPFFTEVRSLLIHRLCYIMLPWG